MTGIKRTLTGCLLSGALLYFILFGGWESRVQGAETNELDGWIGKYTFYEYYERGDLAPQGRSYDIDIYKENGQYYADVAANGHMCGLDVKARVYGDEEWISLVLEEYNPDHSFGFSQMENNVILSLRREGESVYTYWGILSPLWEAEGGVSESGHCYLQRVEESDSMEQSGGESGVLLQGTGGGNPDDMADLAGWVGKYAWSEGSHEEGTDLGAADYDLTIYKEEGQYYADVLISGKDTTIDVKARLYGDEEWISLVLVEYNQGHVAGWEGLENSVLFSLRKQKEDIYTYWGEDDITQDLFEWHFTHYEWYSTYYDSNQYFEQVIFYSSMEEIAALDLPEDMLAFWLVLTGRKPFVSKKEEYQEFYWDEYCWTFGEPREPRLARRFMLVDMNGDGADEIVLYCSPESTQVLYYEDGVVYSYQTAFRGMKRIHTNGIYEGSSGAASTSYHRLTELNPDGWKEETLASVHDGDYKIGEETVSQKEFSDYVLQSIESVELAEAIEFTEDMLDAHLLGDLSEEELFIVKHAPVDEGKEMTTNEPGKGKHMMMFWLVANSYHEFVSTDDRNYREQEFYLKDFRRCLGDSAPDYHVKRFALADLDGDGRDEMLLECDPEVIQVLHFESGLHEREYGSPYEGMVYSYQFPARDMPGIRRDGIYRRYGGGSRIAYHRITEFNAENYTDETLARCFNGHFEVEGQEVSEKEFYDFIESLGTGEKVEFIDFTEENLNKYLLGDWTVCENPFFPFFYPQKRETLSADIQYMNFETRETINGYLDLMWLKHYNNGDLFKLSVVAVSNIEDNLGDERRHIYFYVTSDKIYRLWSCAYQDGEVIRFYNDNDLLMEVLDTDEKLMENVELVCCMEPVTDTLDISETGSHVTITQEGNQVIYSRVDIGANGNREFYESFVWESGKGLVDYKSGYRIEAEILYLENICTN